MKKTERICLGIITGAHGIRGEVKVRSFTENDRDIGSYGVLTDEKGAKTFSVRVVGRSKDDLRIKIEGCDDRNQAEALKGTGLYVERSALPETAEEEFYQTDLIGLEVKSESGAKIGRVEAFYNFGAGDIIEIRVGQKLEMLPFTKEFVPEINIKDGYIIVRDPVSAADDGDKNAG